MDGWVDVIIYLPLVALTVFALDFLPLSFSLLLLGNINLSGKTSESYCIFALLACHLTQTQSEVRFNEHFTCNKWYIYGCHKTCAYTTRGFGGLFNEIRGKETCLIIIFKRKNKVFF